MGADIEDGGEGIDTYIIRETLSYVPVINLKLETAYLKGSDPDYSNSVANMENVKMLGDSAISIIGSDDDNTLNGGAGDDTLDGGDGNDTLRGGAGDDQLVSGLGDDYLYGESGDDVLIGGAGDDTLDGGDGDDEIFGGAGDDTLYSSLGADIEDGGEGIDTYIIRETLSYVPVINLKLETAYLKGSDPDYSNSVANMENVKMLGDSAISIIGSDDDNTLNGGAGDDTLDGGDGNDTLRGGAGDDQLVSGLGDDYLYGESGDDVLIGGAGDDTLDGGDGDDEIFGGAGDDTLYSSLGADIEDGGEGIDTYIIRETLSYVPVINLKLETAYLKGSDPDYSNSVANMENVKMLGDSAISIIGSDDDNTLNGGAGDDTLDGGDGNDTLRGGAGDDTLSGGAGDDQLFGEAGDDTLVQSGSGTQIFDGGAGVDTLYNNTENYNNGLDADPPSWTAAINLSTGFLGVLEAPDHPKTDTVLNIENVHVKGRWNWEITGDEKANLLQSGLGDDVIAGGSGDDFIDAGDGIDYVNGGFGNDTYQVIDNLDDFIEFTDPNNLDLSNHIYITDDGGENDVVAIADTPGRDSYRFVNTGDSVIFQFASGRQVEMMKSDNGSLSVETFRWFHEEHFGLDYSPYLKDFEIVIDPENIRDLSTMFAGTDLGDTVVLPSLSDAISQDNSNGWAEIYLNAGDDIVTMSKDLNFIVYMGAGNDTGYGQDKFSGSIDLGHGDDVYYGGDGDDRVSGSAGDDVLRGW